MAKTRGKKRGGSIGILFWVAFILLIVVIFLYNRPTIERTLENTGLVEVVRERFGRGDRQPSEPLPTPQSEPEVAIELEPADPEPVERTPAPQAEPERQPVPEPAAPEPQSRPPADQQPPQQRQPAEPVPDQPVTRTRVSKLYFIRVTDDGQIFPEQVNRSVTFTNNPMTQTLHALITGPTIEELNAGLLNLVPENTQLISAAVRDGTAYLNFNEAFRFNPMGVEGLVAQLQQVVFSTTEFDTIVRVQILIEGQKVNYLGGDGVYIGEPLDRSSFG
ncbi:MAG: hypothetical protein EA404_10260 [Spirochaetaceae bacterium]|nr:MAG: hypothetical protein EA404_10260 [Spirochaetaceae bacterium]